MNGFIDSLTAAKIRDVFRIPQDYIDQLKFNECLPTGLAEEVMKNRLLRPDSLDVLLKRNRRFVSDDLP